MLGEPGRCQAGGHRTCGALLFCTIRAATLVAPPAMRIDLNADVGESFGAYTMGDDAALMPSITSANIAAGFHGGDPSVLRRTVRLAKAAGVAVGAHPGLPDLAGFGRRVLDVTPDEAEDLVLYQVAAVAGVAAAEGLRLQHVKPHGALFHMAARDSKLASRIARAVAAFDRSLILFGPPRSELLAAGLAAGLRVAAEAFVDRAYEADGTLAPRHRPGSVIRDVDAVVARAIRLAKQGSVVLGNGASLTVHAETICIHGDTPDAALLAARVKSALEAAGVSVQPIGRP